MTTPSTTQTIAQLRAAIAEAKAKGDYKAAGKYNFELASTLFSERLQVEYQKIACEWQPFGEAWFFPGSSQLLRHAYPDQLLIDRGEQGSVTLVFDTKTTRPKISFKGSIGLDLEALIRAALHAKKHWSGKARPTGHAEFLFLSTVASELVGVKTPRLSTASFAQRWYRGCPLFSVFNIPLSRRAEAEELKKKWKPIYEKLLAEQSAPERPAKAHHAPAPAREAAVA